MTISGHLASYNLYSLLGGLQTDMLVVALLDIMYCVCLFTDHSLRSQYEDKSREIKFAFTMSVWEIM